MFVQQLKLKVTSYSFREVYFGMSSFQDAENTTEFKRCPQCGCVGINPGYESLTDVQIDEQFQTLAPGVWVLSEDKKKISRRFVCRNWKAAIDFIDAAGIIAEDPEVNHHPDIHLTKYRDLEVLNKALFAL